MGTTKKKIFPFELTASEIENLKANARKLQRSAGSLIRERIRDLTGDQPADPAQIGTAADTIVTPAGMSAVVMADPSLFASRTATEQGCSPKKRPQKKGNRQ